MLGRRAGRLLRLQRPYLSENPTSEAAIDAPRPLAAWKSSSEFGSLFLSRARCQPKERRDGALRDTLHVRNVQHQSYRRPAEALVAARDAPPPLEA